MRFEVRVVPILYAFGPVLLGVLHGVGVGETAGRARVLVDLFQAVFEAWIGFVQTVQRDRVRELVDANALAAPAIGRPTQDAFFRAQTGVSAESPRALIEGVGHIRIFRDLVRPLVNAE